MNNLYRIFEASNINSYLLPYARYIQRADQLSGGAFYAKTEALYHPELSIFRRCTNQTIRESGRLPDNIHSINFHPNENTFYLRDSYYGIGGISSSLSGHQWESIIQKDSTHYTITLNENSLHNYLDMDERIQLLDFLQVKRDITSCDDLRFEVPNTIDKVFDLISTSSEDDIESICIASRKKIMLALMALVKAAKFNHLRANSNAFLLDKAIHIIGDPDKINISVNELADALHTSRRNIEAVFRSHLNISPKEYINNLRLNEIRTKLLHSSKDNTLVSTIARQYEIHHLSNFSKAYNYLFGELPHETLARQALTPVDA